MTETVEAWKEVAKSTSRLKVNGGHIYCMQSSDGLTSCFVPDVDLQRYQAHLRDAYKKGYEDGHIDCKENTVKLFTD